MDSLVGLTADDFSSDADDDAETVLEVVVGVRASKVWLI